MGGVVLSTGWGGADGEGGMAPSTGRGAGGLSECMGSVALGGARGRVQAAWGSSMGESAMDRSLIDIFCHGWKREQ